MSAAPHPEDSPLEEHIERVRIGHGANCSSVGSVVDTLFATAAVGAAVFAAIVAAMRSEDVRVAGARGPERTPEEPRGTSTADEKADAP
jgi:hypothetical protein